MIDKERIFHGLDAVVKARDGMTDEQAAAVPDLYKAWEPGKEYSAGERVTYGGTLYKILQAHTSQDEWTPDAAPSLFAEILPGQGGTEIGEWAQPDSTNPYMKGDRCMYNGQLYESLIDGNIWAPDAYPQGWKLVG